MQSRSPCAHALAWRARLLVLCLPWDCGDHAESRRALQALAADAPTRRRMALLMALHPRCGAGPSACTRSGEPPEGAAVCMARLVRVRPQAPLPCQRKFVFRARGCDTHPEGLDACARSAGAACFPAWLPTPLLRSILDDASPLAGCRLVARGLPAGSSAG
jgi:hypothetical protein